MAMAARWGMTMVTGTSISMDEDRLLLWQWLSPAFPIGAFAYSQGMEEPMATGTIRTAAEVEAWVTAVLHHGSPRMDAVFCAQAHAGTDPELLSDLLLAYVSCAERETELMEQGRAFTALMTSISGETVPIRPYPVAIGVATRRLQVSRHEVLQLFLHGAAAQMISAATRFLPLGQSVAQAMLSRLAPQIIRLADAAAKTDLDGIATFTPGADMAAMRHETLDVRIFRT